MNHDIFFLSQRFQTSQFMGFSSLVTWPALDLHKLLRKARSAIDTNQESSFLSTTV
jgi:hypothetical protein